MNFTANMILTTDQIFLTIWTILHVCVGWGVKRGGAGEMENLAGEYGLPVLHPWTQFTFA